MRKIISPIVNLVSLILVGIAYGLAGLTAANDVAGNGVGSYYQLVWGNINTFNLVGFFLMIAATVFVFLTFIPKGRKFIAILTGGLLIAAGVMALYAPAQVAQNHLPLTNQPGLIGMAVLLFVAGGFSLIISALEFALSKKD